MRSVRDDLPSGTVTFLFTDVEGSTRLLQELGADQYAHALSEHRRVLREAFAAHGGVEVDTQGDAFFAVFPTAPGALAAAAQAVEAFAPGPIRVRMGLHTGTPHLAEEGYVGVDVHRAARIAACGHGGQVLVSASTASLVDADDLRDQGEHRLKDLSAPERVYQLGAGDFPPLRSLHQTNLPIASTPFLGRERELAEVGGLITRADVRLLTLSGPGGTGKTRLALQAAAQAADAFAGGVWWVPLAALRDPTLVLETAGRAIGAEGELADHIADTSLLLLLDNFEQVVSAAEDLVHLLAACPNLRVLVTSRELLAIRGEQSYDVPPLEPEEGATLFLALARAADPNFVASAAVPLVCARLDNLPLALELAAARVRLLSPEQLLERLSHRLDVLRAGRGVDQRQQTLRATIEWSHDLLDPDERQLFARLAVFTGGFTLDAAEVATDADLDTLQALLDKSLVRRRDGTHEPRFWMLETIREYAVERLEGGHDADRWRRRHADYFLALAERAEPGLTGPRNVEWAERVEVDVANFRTAITWSLRAGPAERSLRLVGALTPFWFKRGGLREGRRWLSDALDTGGEDRPRMKALFGAGLLATLQGDWPESRRLSEECRLLADEFGDDAFGGKSRMTLGRAAVADGDDERARALFTTAVELARKAHDPSTVALATFNLGYAALAAGDYELARKELDTALERFRQSGDDYGIARTLAALGSVALHQQRGAEALDALCQSLALARDLGDRENMAWALQLLGAAYAERRGERAARLLGAAERFREELGLSLQGVELVLHDVALATVRRSVDEEAMNDAWAAGRLLSLEDAVEAALTDG